MSEHREIEIDAAEHKECEFSQVIFLTKNSVGVVRVPRLSSVNYVLPL